MQPPPPPAGRPAPPGASMDTSEDPEVLVALVVAAATAFERGRKRKKCATLLLLEGDDHACFSHHVRIPRAPMSWAGWVASLSERQFKRRYRMPRCAFEDLVKNIAPSMREQHVKLGHRVPEALSFEVRVSAVLRW